MPSDQPTAVNSLPPGVKRRIVLAVTGASGAAYARRLLGVLLGADCEVHLSISPAARQVIAHELGVELNLDAFDPSALLGEREADASRLVYHHHRDLTAAIASGSFLTDGMVICPCSGGTLSAVVHGASTGLIHRAGDVHLKERRKLILVPRETPLSLVHLDNMRRAVEVGAVVLPASPGFYHGPRSIDDLIDFVVARICDQLGVAHRLVRRWGEP